MSAIKQYLDKMRDNAAHLSMSGLRQLSDLSRPELQELKEVWPSLETGRRRQIVRAMVELAEDNVELDFNRTFMACIEDPDEQVRATAVEGLMEDTEVSTSEMLLRLLATDPAPDVRAAAATSLGHFVYLIELEKLEDKAGEKIVGGLRKATEDESPEVQRRAVEAIGYLSKDWVAQIIDKAYHHADAKMRASAVFAMGRNCDGRWLPMILEEMRSDDPEMRYEAARAAGEVEDKRAAPQLVALTRDVDAEVRLAAVDALGQVGGKLAKTTLEKLAESGSEEMREAAEAALDELMFDENPLGFGGHFGAE